MSRQFTPFLVQAIVQETENVRSYRFAFPAQRFQFLPGQFAVTAHPADSTLQGPLTFSTSPLDSEGFELTVKRTGNFGTRFYDEVAVGSAVGIGTPQGKFHLVTGDARPILFLSHDYCVPAARSFVRYLQATSPATKMILIHEWCDLHTALYWDEFLGCADFTGFTYRPFRVAPQEAEDGNDGRLTTEQLSQFLAEMPSPRIYITGEGENVVRLRRQFKSIGIPETELIMERWS